MSNDKPLHFITRKVSVEQSTNEALDMSTRLSHLESDLNGIYDILLFDMERRKEDKERRDKLDAFLEKQIQLEEDRAIFWREAKNKILTKGLISGIGLIILCGWFTFTETVKR